MGNKYEVDRTTGDITGTGTISIPSGEFSQSLTISGVPVATGIGDGSFDSSSDQTITGDWEFSNSLTVSGTPVNTEAPAVVLLATEIVSGNTDFVDLVNNTGESFAAYEIEFANVFSNEGAGAVLTVLVSTDAGSSFDTGNNYTDGGLTEWTTEGVRHIQGRVLVDFGWTVLPDTGEAAASQFGGAGKVFIQTPGVVGSINAHTSFECATKKYELGTKTIGLWMTGHWIGGPGERVNAFRLQFDRVSSATAKVANGLFKLYGRR